jgi:hypothetical protein
MSSASRIINPSNDPCNNTLRSRQYLSGPQIFWLHITGSAIATFDNLFYLGQPCNTFFISSLNKNASTIFLATKLVGRTNPSAIVSITPIGTEEWFPMSAASMGVTGPNFLTVLRFKETVNQLYMALGAEGGVSTWTIACLQDDEVSVSGGPWG